MTEPVGHKRRRGCLGAIFLLALAPGTLLIAGGAWVHAQGGGRAVLVAGVVFLIVGAFVSLVIRGAVQRGGR